MAIKLDRIIKYLKNEISIPREVVSSREYKVLHVSDTPSQIYRPIILLLQDLKPDMFIHTGDLADDIKLELNPGYGRLYARTVSPFLQRVKEIIPNTTVIPGNHDAVSFLKRIKPSLNILSPGTTEIQNHTFGVAHDINDLPEEADFMLYGHNFELPGDRQKSVYLNGVISINIILLPSRQVFSIPYPRGTDHFRRYIKFRRLM